jgi:Golgi SNAP receptor complex protein 1
MDELRREARRLEHGLDAEMVQFGRLDLSEPGLSSAFDVRGREIEAMLNRLQEVNDQMSRQASTATGPAASTMHVLQRHREILHDFMQEFSKTKSNLKSADERQQLLSSVRAEGPAFAAASAELRGRAGPGPDFYPAAQFARPHSQSCSVRAQIEMRA